MEYQPAPSRGYRPALRRLFWFLWKACAVLKKQPQFFWERTAPLFASVLPSVPPAAFFGAAVFAGFASGGVSAAAGRDFRAFSGSFSAEIGGSAGFFSGAGLALPADLALPSVFVFIFISSGASWIVTFAAGLSGTVFKRAPLFTVFSGAAGAGGFAAGASALEALTFFLPPEETGFTGGSICLSRGASCPAF